MCHKKAKFIETLNFKKGMKKNCENNGQLMHFPVSSVGSIDYNQEAVVNAVLFSYKYGLR